MDAHIIFKFCGDGGPDEEACVVEVPAGIVRSSATRTLDLNIVGISLGHR